MNKYKSFIFFFILFPITILGQDLSQLAKKYNDSALLIYQKTKNSDSAINYFKKAIVTDSNYINSYENILPYLTGCKRYNEAEIIVNKLIILTDKNESYYSLLGVLLENKGDSISAFKKYSEAEEKFKLKQSSTSLSDFSYKYIVINRAMNLLFLYNDTLARNICTDFYEQKKEQLPSDWLIRILSLTRENYFDILLSRRKHLQ